MEKLVVVFKLDRPQESVDPDMLQDTRDRLDGLLGFRGQVEKMRQTGARLVATVVPDRSWAEANPEWKDTLAEWVRCKQPVNMTITRLMWLDIRG